MSQVMPFAEDSDEVLMPKSLYSAQAEQAVLGCWLAQPTEVSDQIQSELSDGDFFVPTHKEIFKTLQGMAVAQIAIDIQIVHQRLVDRKMAEAVGSPGILAELLVGFATHLNVGSYIKIVKDKSLLRCLQMACSTIVQDIVEMPDSVPAVLDRAEAAIFRITHGRQTGQIWSAEQAVCEFRAERESIQRGDKQNRLETGIQALDKDNGGLPNPGLIIIGAATGAGKSVLMMNFLENWCRVGMGVGVFSLEMTRKQLIKRAVASVAQMNSRLLNGKLHEAQQNDVARALSNIENWRFWIDQTSRLTLPELRTRSRQMVKMGAEAIEVDYLQLLRGIGRQDRREFLAEASGEMKILSTELNIPFIVLSQVNREGRKSGDLQLLHLAECSALEQDSDEVILLEKKAGCDNCPQAAIPYIAHIAKYRDGAIGDVELTLNAPQLRFS